MECKGKSKDSLAGVLDGFRKTMDEFHNMHTVKGARSKEVCNREAIEDYKYISINFAFKKHGSTGTYGR